MYGYVQLCIVCIQAESLAGVRLCIVCIVQLYIFIQEHRCEKTHKKLYILYMITKIFGRSPWESRVYIIIIIIITIHKPYINHA